jgi:hypothetical protein
MAKRGTAERARALRGASCTEENWDMGRSSLERCRAPLLPRRRTPFDALLARRAALLAGIRAGGATLAFLPKSSSPSVVCAQSLKRSIEIACFVRRTVAGAAQVRSPHAERDFLLLPV